jgi:hypothetical protein
MTRRDSVTPYLAAQVFARDGGCVGERLGALDDCAGRLTLDHVKDYPMMGKRAPSDMRHLVSLCWHHHLDGWATSHRPDLLEIVAEVGAMPTILAIDPGTVQSAWVLFAGGRPVAFDIWPNADLLDALRYGGPTAPGSGYLFEPTISVIEQVASYGMPVGAEVFETVRWAGRFEEALHPTPVVLLPRMAVKMHLCGNSRAKDANIRRALLDKFGGPSFDPKVAVGTKKAPGPLYGIKADLWAALAIAVTFSETRQ